MGCGASSSAASVEEGESPSKTASSDGSHTRNGDTTTSANGSSKTASSSLGTTTADASVIGEYAAVGAAAGVVAGAAATGLATVAASSAAGNPSSTNPVMALSKVTGEALLELAKTLPIVAPVAFLIGAIASSAVSAVNLKSDCLEFGKIVSTLEGILVKGIENITSPAPTLYIASTSTSLLSSQCHCCVNKRRHE